MHMPGLLAGQVFVGLDWTEPCCAAWRTCHTPAVKRGTALAKCYDGGTNPEGLRHGFGKYTYPNGYCTYEGWVLGSSANLT